MQLKNGRRSPSNDKKLYLEKIRNNFTINQKTSLNGLTFSYLTSAALTTWPSCGNPTGVLLVEIRFLSLFAYYFF